jgi:hypothetical protein
LLASKAWKQISDNLPYSWYVDFEIFRGGIFSQAILLENVAQVIRDINFLLPISAYDSIARNRLYARHAYVKRSESCDCRTEAISKANVDVTDFPFCHLQVLSYSPCSIM